MAFVDKIEKMEQKFWPIAFKKTKEATRKTLSPKNYKWGILGMILYALGSMVAYVLVRIDADEGLLRWADATFILPIFSDHQGNIWHDE